MASPADSASSRTPGTPSAEKPSDSYVQSFARGLSVDPRVRRPPPDPDADRDRPGQWPHARWRAAYPAHAGGAGLCAGRWPPVPAHAQDPRSRLRLPDLDAVLEPGRADHGGARNRCMKAARSPCSTAPRSSHVLRVPARKIMTINLSIGGRLPAYCLVDGARAAVGARRRHARPRAARHRAGSAHAPHRDRHRPAQVADCRHPHARLGAERSGTGGRAGLAGRAHPQPAPARSSPPSISAGRPIAPARRRWRTDSCRRCWRRPRRFPGWSACGPSAKTALHARLRLPGHRDIAVDEGLAGHAETGAQVVIAQMLALLGLDRVRMLQPAIDVALAGAAQPAANT